MEFVKFVFSSFWTFAGFFLFGFLAFIIIKAFFDFIVELIHGKQPIVNIPESAKFISSGEEKIGEALMKNPPAKKSDGKEHAAANVQIKVGDVKTISRKK